MYFPCVYLHLLARCGFSKLLQRFILSDGAAGWDSEQQNYCRRLLSRFGQLYRTLSPSLNSQIGLGRHSKQSTSLINQVQPLRSIAPSTTPSPWPAVSPSPPFSQKQSCPNLETSQTKVKKTLTYPITLSLNVPLLRYSIFPSAR